MTIAVRPLQAADLLGQAIERVRPHLHSSFPIGQRLRNLWAGVVAARELASADVIEAEFVRLAKDTGVARGLGRHAEEDLQHVIRWALFDRNPFG